MSDEQWLDVDAAAKLAGCGRRFIYLQVRAGRLRASRLDGRGTLRFRPNWISEWLESAAPAVVGNASSPAEPVAHASVEVAHA